MKNNLKDRDLSSCSFSLDLDNSKGWIFFFLERWRLGFFFFLENNSELKYPNLNPKNVYIDLLMDINNLSLFWIGVT